MPQHHHHHHHHQQQQQHHSRKDHHHHHHSNHPNIIPNYYPNYNIYPYSSYTIMGTPIVYRLTWKTSLIIFGVIIFIIGIIYLILFLTKSGPFNKHNHDQQIQSNERPKIVSLNT